MGLPGTPVARCRPEVWGSGGGGGSRGEEGLWGEMSELPGAYVHGRGLRQLGLTPGRPQREVLCRNSFHR